ncbi:MAG: glycosyltransferase [Roseburia sp.]|nr:glycosyltransferase [Roseburia sp.]
MEKKIISFVIPCYRSEKTVGKVIEEIKTVIKEREEYDYEIIAVNDSSPDNVYSVLIENWKEDNHIAIVDLAANAGKQSAVMAGLTMVHGEIIVCLDDDCQCPVYELWKLIDGLDQGYDIAMARYGIKKESAFRNLGSFLNSQMFNLLLGKPKNLQLTNFYAIKKFVIEEMLRYKNPYPYLHGLMLRTTKNIISIPMKERERAEGTSGYTLKKLISFWADGLTGFSVKPLRIAIGLGCLCAGSGFIYGLYLIIRKIVYVNVAVGWTSLMALQLFLGGIIMLILGLIGEYIGRIYICINSSPQYVIREARKNKFEEEE